MNNHCNTKKKESIRRKSHHHQYDKGGPSRRISMDTTSGDEKVQQLSSLPYANNNKTERHTRHSHPTSSNNKTKPHRRASYTGITAQTAQEMVAEMLNDKNTTSSSNAHHQQHHSRGHTTTTTRQKQQKAQQRPPPRRVTVSFGPTKDQLQQLRNSTQTQYDQQLNHNNSMPDIHNSHPQSNTHKQQRQHMGYRPDYKLGQVARSPTHLLIPPSTSTNTNNKQKYIKQIATLLKHDFAFVKRSNGLYSYAILAYRTNPGRLTNPNSKSGHAVGGNNNNSDDYYNGEYKEEGMAFVMDDVGSTKMIRKKHWYEYIRLVSMDDLSCNDDDDSGMGIEEGDYDMGEGLNHTSFSRGVTPSHPDVNLSYQQFKSRTAARQGDPQDDPQENVPQDMLCQEIPQVCQEVNPQVYQEQEREEEMFEFEDEPLPEMISFDPSSGENEDCSLISSVSDRARRANSARVWR